MDPDLQVVAETIRHLSTEELLDRVTLYRKDMEEAAIELIAAELLNRGVTPEDVGEHLRRRSPTALQHQDGSFVKCSFCNRLALVQAWAWYPFLRELGFWLPLIPRPLRYCQTHAQVYGHRIPPRE